MKISLVGMGNVASAGLGFLYLAVAAKFLDLETFGKYALITTLLISISKLIDFGTNSVFVARTISDNNTKLINSFYTLKIILTLLAVPISIVTLLLFKITDLTIIFLFTGGLVAYSVYFTTYAFLQKNEMYTVLISVNFLPAIIKGTFAALVFFGLIQINLINATAVFSLPLIISGIGFYFLPSQDCKFKWDTSELKFLLKKSYPAGISQFIYESFPSLGNTIIKITSGFQNVGIFSLANKISHIFTLISLSIFTVLLPKNAGRKSKNQPYDFNETGIIAALILLASIVASFVAGPVLNILFKEKFSQSLPLLDVLIFASAITAIHTFMENYFFIHDKTNNIMYINVGKLLIYLVFATFLVNKIGIIGIAFADLTASFSALIATLIYIKKHEKLLIA